MSINLAHKTNIILIFNSSPRFLHVEPGPPDPAQNICKQQE